MIKSRESSGMAAFLKRQDPNLEDLKKKYFSDDSQSAKSSAYKAEKTQFQHWSDIERYIDKQSRLKQSKMGIR